MRCLFKSGSLVWDWLDCIRDIQKRGFYGFPLGTLAITPSKCCCHRCALGGRGVGGGGAAGPGPCIPPPAPVLPVVWRVGSYGVLPFHCSLRHSAPCFTSMQRSSKVLVSNVAQCALAILRQRGAVCCFCPALSQWCHTAVVGPPSPAAAPPTNPPPPRPGDPNPPLSYRQSPFPRF